MTPNLNVPETFEVVNEETEEVVVVVEEERVLLPLSELLEALLLLELLLGVGREGRNGNSCSKRVALCGIVATGTTTRPFDIRKNNTVRSNQS